MHEAIKEQVLKYLPTEVPQGLIQASKNEPIHEAWPIGSPREALELLIAWEIHEGRAKTYLSVGELAQHITHSHAYEGTELAVHGYENVYRKGLSTKFVSIGWHVAGRYTQDDYLTKYLDDKGWPKLKLIDFGAAPWIQTCYYAKRGLQVTAVNQSKESDCHRFGRFMAQYRGIPDEAINDFGCDDNWEAAGPFDIVYCVDVLEHIPPLPDGSPGWIPYAKRLIAALKPGGVAYMNSPMEPDPGVPKPVSYHPVHFTSPILLGDWLTQQGIKTNAYNLWEKP